jgi:hypothetical protein
MTATDGTPSGEEPYTVSAYGFDAESTHDAAGIANFNESVYVNFLDPVSRLGGLLRIGNRPTLGYREASIQLTLPNGAIAFRAGREHSSGNDDFATQGLSVTVERPTRSLHLGYDNSVAYVRSPAGLAENGRATLKSSPSVPCRVDLRWEASSPMFALDESGDVTPGDSQFGTDHYEQFGTVAGTVSVGDATWRLEAVPSMRDHSWGAREWSSFTGEWLCAALADGTRITAYSETGSSGVHHSSGFVVTPQGGFHRVVGMDVHSVYDGSPTYAGRYLVVLQAEGLPTLPLDGTIRHFVPVTQRTEDRGVRMAQMTVDFVGGHGGSAVAEFIRPLRNR